MAMKENIILMNSLIIFNVCKFVYFYVFYMWGYYFIVYVVGYSYITDITWILIRPDYRIILNYG